MSAKRICVVGAGRWGANHIRTLAGLGVLAGIVEPGSAARARVAAEYPAVPVFDDVSAALAQPFDGFTVATPAETHYRIAKTLIEAKKHVLVEKPITLTSAHARELQALAHQHGVNLMVGHVLLFHPAIRKIKDMVDSGKLGKLQYLYSNRLNLGTVRTEENILWSFAPHDISIFQYLVGTRPDEVTSRGGAFLQPHLHDSTMTMLSYPGNVVGHIFVSWLHPFKEQRLVVIGSKGMVSFDDSTAEKALMYYEKGFDWIHGQPIKRDGPTETIPYDALQPLTEELKYFADHTDGRPVEIADSQNALEVLEILERASADLIAKEPDMEQATPAPKFFVHPSSYADEGCEIGEGTKIWHFSHVQGGSKIGKGCSIGQNVNVGNNVTIGNHCKLQNNVSVYEGVTLEDYVFCGPSMVFTNVLDPRCKYPQRGSDHYHKTLIKEGASLGANCTIVCGHTVGRHAFVAAGAVVAADVPDYALMMGVPARQKGWVCECGEQLRDVKIMATCTRCTRRYKLSEGKLIPAE